MNRKKAYEDLILSCTLPEHRKETWEKKIETIFRYSHIEDKDVRVVLEIILSEPSIVKSINNLAYKSLGDNTIDYPSLKLTAQEQDIFSSIIWNNSVLRFLKLLVKEVESHG